jgi:Leucine-rich repeat (LRR) protein
MATIAASLPLNAVAAIPQIEREALITIYNATNGDGWEDRSGWRNDEDTDFNEPGTECYWHGIYCDSGRTTVTSIYLGANQLSGTIPVEIGNLTGLVNLSLATNQLGGTIPSEIGNLTRLEALYLSASCLEGPIPAEIGGLTSLRRLTLGSDQLSGPIPAEIGNLTRLETLYIAASTLEGPIPAEIGSLTSLQRLGLWRNQLSGPIPAEIGNLTSLESLRLEENRLEGEIPPEIGNLTNLDYLWLHCNLLSGTIPAEIGNLTGLNSLSLYYNRLSGPIPPEIGNLTKLWTLHLFSNQLSGEIPTEIGNLTNLFPATPISSDLDLRWNALYSNDPDLVAFLSSMHSGGDWQSTQTIAPDGVTVTSVSDHTVWLEWTAIAYSTSAGGYQVHSAEVPGGSTVSGGFTSAKTVTTYPVTGLQPGQSYDLLVQSFTDPHVVNYNTVLSEISAPVMATTSNLGCTAPQVSVSSSCATNTLTVQSSHDSYEWVTGETTASISVRPGSSTWYWVRAFGPGSCDEAAEVLVTPSGCLHEDGFESGDTSAWSSMVQ